jgi:MFS transporter, DHA1 family, tetracycline resistance protein
VYLVIGLTGVFILTVNTVVADVSMGGGQDLAASNYGMLGAVYGASFMVGPVLGGVLEDRLYPTASFHVAAVMVAVSIMWTFFGVPETLSDPLTQNGLTRRPDQRHPQPEPVRLLRVIQSVNLNPIPRIRSVFSGEALRWLASAIALSSLAQGSLNSIFFLYLHTRVGWGSSVSYAATDGSQFLSSSL